MSLEDIRSECADVAGLLQPYIDGELNNPEQEQVAEHLHGCQGCRSAVAEQAWVRATLQSLEREPAPQALRARIFQELDEIDREHAVEAAPAAPPGFARRLWARLGDLGRGGLIMVPAGAAALALFVVAQQDGPATDPSTTQNPGYLVGAITPSAGAQRAADEDVMRALADLQPQVGFSVQVPDAATGTGDLQLVHAQVDRAAAGNAAQLRYRLMRQGEPTGHHVIDRQLPAPAANPQGTPLNIGGRQYRLSQQGGQAVLYFQVGSVAHVLHLEGQPSHTQPAAETPADVAVLLNFADRLSRITPPQPSRR